MSNTAKLTQINPAAKPLLSVDVLPHTRKKGSLTYLPWSWAWAEAIKADPAASWNLRMFGPETAQTPLCWIGETALVFVSATIFGKTIEVQLPVMDNKNAAIKNPDAFAVNKAVMRCLVKAIALHGLGLAVFAGEDMSEPEAQEVPSELATASREAAANGTAAFTAFWKAQPVADRAALAPLLGELKELCQKADAAVAKAEQPKTKG